MNWASWKLSVERFLQYLAVIFWMMTTIFGVPISCSIFAFLIIKGNTIVKTLCIIYIIYIYCDRNKAHEGGLRVGRKWVRRLKVWKYLQDYFPVNLVKTVDLSPERNYIFAIFPHGILSTGAISNFAYSYSKKEEYFPKMRIKGATLNFMFNVPFFREYLLSVGAVSVSEKSIRFLMTTSNDPKDPYNSDGYTSNAVGIVVGGSQEALYCRPNNYQIVIKRRKGFVRLAIKTGCPIVPVLSFGEVDIYDQVPNPPGSLLRKFQETVKKFSRFVTPIPKGVFWFIPFRKPITTVVGAPVEVKQNDNPTGEEIDKVHESFVKALVELFESHKEKYVKDFSNVHLILE